MSDIAISVQNRSKHDTIGAAQEYHDTNAEWRMRIAERTHRPRTPHFAFHRSLGLAQRLLRRFDVGVAAHPLTSSGPRQEPEILLVHESLS